MSEYHELECEITLLGSTACTCAKRKGIKMAEKLIDFLDENHIAYTDSLEKECAALKREVEGLKIQNGVLHQASLIAYEQRDSTVESLQSKLKTAEEALQVSIGWMEPIMDGFDVRRWQTNGEPSSRQTVLEKAKEALQQIREKGEKV